MGKSLQLLDANEAQFWANTVQALVSEQFPKARTGGLTVIVTNIVVVIYNQLQKSWDISQICPHCKNKQINSEPFPFLFSSYNRIKNDTEIQTTLKRKRKGTQGINV